MDFNILLRLFFLHHPDRLTIIIILHSEAVVQKCSVKKVFLEISQNSQENTCVRVTFLIKVVLKNIL